MDWLLDGFLRLRSLSVSGLACRHGIKYSGATKGASPATVMQAAFYAAADRFSDSHARAPIVINDFMIRHIDGYEELHNTMAGLNTELVHVAEAGSRHGRSDYVLRFTWQCHSSIVRFGRSRIKCLSAHLNVKNMGGIARWAPQVLSTDPGEGRAVRVLGAAVASVGAQQEAMSNQVAHMEESFQQRMGAMEQRMQHGVQGVAGRVDALEANVAGLSADARRLRAQMEALPEQVLAAVRARLDGLQDEQQQAQMLENLTAVRSGGPPVHAAREAAGTHTAVSTCAICLTDVLEEEEEKGILCWQLGHALHAECCRGVNACMQAREHARTHTRTHAGTHVFAPPKPLCNPCERRCAGKRRRGDWQPSLPPEPHRSLSILPQTPAGVAI